VHILYIHFAIVESVDSAFQGIGELLDQSSKNFVEIRYFQVEPLQSQVILGEFLGS
jgi:hypothetical protein